MHSRNISALQTEMEGAQADILQIRESQADLRDAIKKTATKDDISTVRDDISHLKITQQRQEQLLQEILNRLPPKQ